MKEVFRKIDEPCHSYMGFNMYIPNSLLGKFVILEHELNFSDLKKFYSISRDHVGLILSDQKSYILGSNDYLTNPDRHIVYSIFRDNCISGIINLGELGNDLYSKNNVKSGFIKIPMFADIYSGTNQVFTGFVIQQYQLYGKLETHAKYINVTKVMDNTNNALKLSENLHIIHDSKLHCVLNEMILFSESRSRKYIELE